MRRRAGIGISLTRCRGALTRTRQPLRQVCSTPTPTCTVIDEICFAFLKRAKEINISSPKIEGHSRYLQNLRDCMANLFTLRKNWGCGIRVAGEAWPPCARARTSESRVPVRTELCESAGRWEGTKETRGRLRRIDLVILVGVLA